VKNQVQLLRSTKISYVYFHVHTCYGPYAEAFRRTTNLMMKLVPILSDCLPSLKQDILCHTITKQAQCIAEFKYVSNPHIDLLDNPSVALSNHSLCSIVLAYCHNCKNTFLSLDQDHSTGQVILTYPQKYWSAANGHVHHLVKYMEYENGTQALCWFMNKFKNHSL